MTNARAIRRYDATRRREQKARTRTRVIEAAARVFLEAGYVGATMPRIAAEAGVAVETVYRAAPGKAGLLEAAVGAAVAGGVERAEVPIDERPAIRKVIDEPDARVQLALYASTQPGIWSRVGPLLRVLDAAAASDEALARLRDQMESGRRAGLGRFAALLAERGSLRPGLTPELAGDLIWAICARANYDNLVLTCGWSHEAYETWLTDALIHLVVGPI